MIPAKQNPSQSCGVSVTTTVNPSHPITLTLIQVHSQMSNRHHQPPVAIPAVNRHPEIPRSVPRMSAIAPMPQVSRIKPETSVITVAKLTAASSGIVVPEGRTPVSLNQVEGLTKFVASKRDERTVCTKLEDNRQARTSSARTPPHIRGVGLTIRRGGEIEGITAS